MMAETAAANTQRKVSTRLVRKGALIDETYAVFQHWEVGTSVKANLRRKMLPTIRAVDLVWNLDAKTVWFWSHNRAMSETLEELFERTFGLRLVPHNTYCSLLHAGLTERTLERVVAQEPADFVR